MMHAMTPDSIREAHRLILHMQPDYCRTNCPGGPSPRDHEATCAEASEWLDAHPVGPPFLVPAGAPRVQTGPHTKASG